MRRRALPAAAGVVLFALTAQSAAAEEVFTAQAERIGATSSTWAPPASRPAAICLVDTGVDVNPDTATTVVARFAVDGGDGADASSTKHGTLMAMIAAAPLNDWGMVGIAPGQPIVSVRVLPKDGPMRLDDIRAGIIICRQRAAEFNIRVINLSLGASGPQTPAATTAIGDAIDGARTRGLSVIAAAGNTPGPVETPASHPSVVAVGAATASGAMCDFAAGPPDVVAPGCALDVAIPSTGAPAWAQGSSEASVQTSAVAAQLVSHHPELDPDAAENLLFSSARGAEGGLAIDVARLWHAAGLDALLLAGAAARPTIDTGPRTRPGDVAPITTPTPPPTTIPGYTTIDPPDPGKPATTRWPRPRVSSVGFRRNVLTIKTTRAPSGATLTLHVSGRARGKSWTRTTRGHGPQLRLRLPGTWRTATLQLRGAGRTGSPSANIRPPRRCARACRR